MNVTGNWIVFVTYGIVMLYIGFLGYKKAKTVEDFYVAGRTFGLEVAVPLFAASFISSASIVGYTGFAYGYGWSLIAMYPIGCAGGWILLQIFSNRIYNSKFEWYSTPDLYCSRYYDEGFTRIFMALFNICFMLIYIIIGLIGIGTILEVFLNAPYFLCVIIVAVILLIYTCLGGMYSVGWTNVVQWTLLTIGIVVAAVVALKMAGGLSNVNAAIYNVEGGITNLTKGAMHSITAGGKISIGKIIGLVVGISLVCPCAVYYHRIFFSVRSKKVAGSFIGISAIFLVISYICIAIIGISTRVLLPNLKLTEHAFPSLVTIFPAVLALIIIAAIIAAIQSTLDNQLLSAGTMATNDIYCKFFIKNNDTSGKNIMVVSRWITFLIGLIALIVALIRPGLVIQLYNFIMILAPTVLFPPLVLGLYWKRTTKEAEIFGSLFGLIGGLAWIFFGPKTLPATLVILPINIILMAIISLVTPEPPKHVIEKFFSNI